jgi:hypothetical protein
VAFAENLAEFLADFGVSVSFTGSPAGMLGIVDAPGAHLLDLGSSVVSASERTVLIRTDQVGLLVSGSTIVVDGVSRIVRDYLPTDDGAFTLVSLR